MEFLDRISQALNKMLIGIAGVFLVAMVVLTCSDVFLRGVWVPITGSVELVGLFSAIVAAFSMGYTQARGGHIAVDVVSDLFPAKLKRCLRGLNNLICIVFFVAATWQMVKWSRVLWSTGELTETLRIIFYPFSYGVALGCAVLSFVFLTSFFKLLKSKKETEK